MLVYFHLGILLKTALLCLYSVFFFIVTHQVSVLSLNWAGVRVQQCPLHLYDKQSPITKRIVTKPMENHVKII